MRPPKTKAPNYCAIRQRLGSICCYVTRLRYFDACYLKEALRDFWDLHPESESALVDWFRKAKGAKPASFPELWNIFSSADYVDGFTIFDVGGNRYRIIAVIHYDKQRLYVRNVLTHAQYDRNRWRKR